MLHRVINAARVASRASMMPVTQRAVAVAAWRSYHPSLARFNEAVAEKTEVSSQPITLDSLAASGKVPEQVIRTVKSAHFTGLTPTQEATIVPTLETENGLVVRAKTGTGKTFAYLLPIIADLFPSLTHSLKNKHKVFHLVIVPTRDLAEQVELELRKMIFKRSPCADILSRISVMTGARRVQFESLFSPSIVIATPGRLLAFLQEKRHLRKFAKLRSRVIDEADRLLDSGFEQDLLEIDRLLQSVNLEYENTGKVGYKTILYSATFDQNVHKFAQKHIDQDYQFIDCVGEDAGEAHENVDQQLIRTNSLLESVVGSFKFILEGLKNSENEKFKAIVFLPTQTGVEWYNDMMRAYVKDDRSYSKKDVQILKLHGNMSQNARQRVTSFFRRAKSSVIICTDIAARGLDFPDVTHVIQTGPSVEIANYIHKIGRTARAGTEGKALLYLPKTNENFARTLESEKDIKFNSVTDYDTYEQDVEYLLQHHDHNSPREEQDFVLEEFVRTYLAYGKTVSSVYRIDALKIFEEIYFLLRFFHSDKESKISVGSNFLQNVLRIPRRDAVQFFDVPDSYNFDGPQRRRGNSSKGNRFGRFDKNSSGPGFNDRSGRSDRSYSNKGGYGSRDGGDRGFNSRDRNSRDDRGFNSRGRNSDRRFNSRDGNSRDGGYNSKRFEKRDYDNGSRNGDRSRRPRNDRVDRSDDF